MLTIQKQKLSVHDPWQEQPTISENFTLLEGLMNCNSNLPNIDPLLTADQVALRLNCSLPQAYAMMRSGKFPVIRMDRMVRVKSSSLEAYIEKMVISCGENQLNFIGTNSPFFTDKSIRGNS